ncbi:MAG TPA: UPF0147 family protein [Candidatus Nanoarchaeia archaeon]|nr:UPF0147 family protein [Candidatus Nanoarchaeia archaeon]
MSAEDEVKDVANTISELDTDTTVPRNVKEKLRKVSEILNKNEELKSRVNKALNEMDEIADDMNIQPYTRTQIWNIVSILEKYA